MNKKYLILIIIVLIAIIGVYIFFNSNNVFVNNSISINANALDERGNLTVNGSNQEVTNGLYSTDSSDANTLFVGNSGILKITGSIINKTGDTKSSGDDADFYGVNSAVLVKDSAKVNVENCEINTDSKGSNGIFATNTNNEAQASPMGGNPDGQMGDDKNSNDNGNPPQKPPEESSGNSSGGNAQQSEKPPEQSSDNNNGGNAQPPEKPSDDSSGNSSGGNAQQPDKPQENSVNNNGGEITEANVKNVKITTYQDKSRGLDATFGGVITADNVEINTRGGSCAAIATDRGDGNVTVTNSLLNTGVDKNNGLGSPLIYSTGNITVSNSKGTSNVAQIACIEGKNSISLNNCDFNCFAEGNRKDGDNYVDLGGIFIYQSMSGDADVGTSLFDCENSVLSIDKSSDYYSKAPMFYITNTKANINLKSSTFNFGSGILFDISGQNQWGNEGSNGGDVNLTTTDEDLKGNINVDSISSLNFNLKSTSFEGAINSTGNTSVVIDEGSSWSLTEDSNITSLDNHGSVNLNGHTLLVNGESFKN